MNNDRRVVVTGLGIVSPVGSKIELAWDNIISGKSGVSRIRQFDTSNFHTNFAASILDFEPEDYISSKVVRRTDLFILTTMYHCNSEYIILNYQTTNYLA